MASLGPLFCRPCGRSFVDKEALQQHINKAGTHRQGSASKEHYCSVCSRLFSDAVALRMHYENSTVHIIGRAAAKPIDSTPPAGATAGRTSKELRQSLYCRVCDKRFRDFLAMKQHVENSSAHVKSETRCEECDKDFKDHVALQQHLEYSSVHNNKTNEEKERILQQANKFTAKGKGDERNRYRKPSDAEVTTLAEVLLGPRPERPLNYCEKCKKGFKDQCALKMHLDNSPAHARQRRRLPKQIYYCEECDKEFKDDIALLQHKEKSPVHKWGAQPVREQDEEADDKDEEDDEPNPPEAPELLISLSDGSDGETVRRPRPVIRATSAPKTSTVPLTCPEINSWTSRHTRPETKPYCYICKIEFKDELALKEHLNRTAHNKPPGSIAPESSRSTTAASIRETDDGLFMCLQCNRGFVDSTALSMHLNHSIAHLGRHSIEPFECTPCNLSFHTKRLLSEHLALDIPEHEDVDVGPITYSCTKCHKNYPTQEELDSHFRSPEHGFPRYTCVQCNSSFGNEAVLDYHIRMLHMLYPCNQDGCDQCFSTKEALEKHRYRSHKHISQCPYCDEDIRDMTRHINEFHSFKCPSCPSRRPFLTEEELEGHLEKVHPVSPPSPPPAKPLIAVASKPGKSELPRRPWEAPAEAQKSFRCGICKPCCGKIFQSKSELEAHVDSAFPAPGPAPKPIKRDLLRGPQQSHAEPIISPKIKCIVCIPACGLTFTNDEDLATHVEFSNPPAPPPRPVPSKLLRTQSSTESLQETSWGDSEPETVKESATLINCLICKPSCGNTFNCQMDLVEHVRSVIEFAYRAQGPAPAPPTTLAQQPLVQDASVLTTQVSVTPPTNPCPPPVSFLPPKSVKYTPGAFGNASAGSLPAILPARLNKGARYPPPSFALPPRPINTPPKNPFLYTEANSDAGESQEGGVSLDEAKNENAWLVLPDTNAEREKLNLLVHSKELLGQNGYILRIPTKEDLEAQIRCVYCKERLLRIQRMKQRGFDDCMLDCRWHTGKLKREFNHRTRALERLYTCCLLPEKAQGCQTRQHKWTPPRVPNVICTPPRDTAPTAQPKRFAVSIDCEMGTGIQGTRELIQLCVADYFTSEILVNKLVRPPVRVVNYSTRYSGVTRAMMEAAVKANEHLDGWKGAQEELFKYIDADTILIGHSLNNDLGALHLAHERVVDSSLAIPKIKTNGHSLKALTEELLNKRIQTAGDTGHVCAEDALAARELVIWAAQNPDKVAERAECLRMEKEDLERERRVRDEKKMTEKHLRKENTLIKDVASEEKVIGQEVAEEEEEDLLLMSSSSSDEGDVGSILPS